MVPTKVTAIPISVDRPNVVKAPTPDIISPIVTTTTPIHIGHVKCLFKSNKDPIADQIVREE
eukprot:XP_001708045.1 Hypothetical protein GL50803_9280 [Giardia lamblia ATCC 50803]